MNHTPTILVFHVEDPAWRLQIEMALFPIGIPLRYVEKKDYNQAIGYLANVDGMLPAPGSYTGMELSDAMMIFCNVPEEKLSQILSAFRALQVKPIACKAVLTKSNQFWTAPQLYAELRREHEEFQKLQKAQDNRNE